MGARAEKHIIVLGVADCREAEKFKFELARILNFSVCEGVIERFIYHLTIVIDMVSIKLEEKRLKAGIFCKKIDLVKLISEIETIEPIILKYNLEYNSFSDNATGYFDGGTELTLQICNKNRRYKGRIRFSPGPGIFDSRTVAENYLAKFKRVLESI